MCLFYETQQHNRMHSYGQQSWRKLPNSGPEDPSVWKPIHLSHFDMAGCLQKPSSPSVTDLSHTRAQLAMCGPVWSKNKLSSDFFPLRYEITVYSINGQEFSLGVYGSFSFKFSPIGQKQCMAKCCLTVPTSAAAAKSLAPLSHLPWAVAATLLRFV